MKVIDNIGINKQYAVLFDGTIPFFRSVIVHYAMLAMIVSGSLLSVRAVRAPCPSPSMGWNSYDCYSYAVTEAQFMANVHYIAANLKKYGWEYCVVDFVWWIPLNGQYGNNQSGNWNFGNIDQYGRFLPDTTRFPSAKGGKGFKPLSDSVHNLGLKFGIHLMRGIPRMAVRKNSPILNSTYTSSQAADQNSTCAWLDWMYGMNMSTPAGQAYLNSILGLYNDWGVDFLKVDDLTSPYHDTEVEGYAKAIASVSREIVLSTSPGPTPVNKAAHVMQYANQWRLVNDLWDDWGQITNAVNTMESWRNAKVNGDIIAGPGHWPDVDMLPFGRLALYGPVGSPRYSLSKITKGEHRVLFFDFCINNNPLMWGGNLPDNTNDRFYDSLMTNSDAIFINQHGVRGKVIKAASTGTPVVVSTHPTDTATKFLMIANTSSSQQTVSVTLNTIGFPAAQAVAVRNVWTKTGMGEVTGTFTQTIPSHDAGLYILGNGLMTAVDRPPPKPSSSSAGSVCLTTGSRYEIPDALAGKTIRVSTFSINGKLLQSTVMRDCLVVFFKNNRCSEQIGIVKISVIR